MRRGRLWIWPTALLGLLAAPAACSESSAPEGTGHNEALSDAATTDGASESSRGDRLDANADSPHAIDATPGDDDVICAVSPCAIALYAASNTACALLSDHTVQCWGANEMGQLGRGEDAGVGTYSPRPAPVVGIHDVQQVSVGPAIYSTAVCAVLSDGSVSCWGANDFGQLGRSTSFNVDDEKPHPTPAPVVGLQGSVRAVDTDGATACAAKEDGRVSCWGNLYGVLFPFLAEYRNYSTYPPMPISVGDNRISKMVVSESGAFPITDDHRVLSRGYLGYLSSLDAIDRPYRELPGLPPIWDMAVSSRANAPDHACAITNGSVMCWGDNQFGQLGRGTFQNDKIPGPIVNSYAPAYAKRIAVSSTDSCVVTSAKEVWCWGFNGAGQIAPSPEENRYELPTRVEGLAGPAVRVATMANSVCVLLASGVVQCWGDNSVGELGSDRVGAFLPPQTIVFERVGE